MFTQDNFQEYSFQTKNQKGKYKILTSGVCFVLQKIELLLPFDLHCPLS